MNRLLLTLSIVLALVMMAWSGRQYFQQKSDAERAVGQLQTVSGQATELARLKANAPIESRRSRPAPGIASRLAEVVAVSGLSQGSVQNVTPEVESSVNGGTEPFAYRKSAVRLTLDPITLPELGRFLQNWRGAEPVWTVSTIDLAPTSHPAKGQQKPLRAALVIETVFAQDAPTTPEGKH